MGDIKKLILGTRGLGKSLSYLDSAGLVQTDRYTEQESMPNFTQALIGEYMLTTFQHIVGLVL